MKTLRLLPLLATITLVSIALPQYYGEPPPPLRQNLARDWLEDLAQFPIMTSAKKVAVLRKIPQLPAVAMEIYRTMYRTGVDVDDALESQRVNLTRSAEVTVELQRAIRAGTTEAPYEGEGIYTRSDGDGLVWLAINALEIGLADRNETVNAAAQNCLETLLPSRFMAKNDPNASPERTYRDFEPDIAKEINVTFRRFATANRDWLARAGKKSEMLRPVAVLRAELKEEAFRAELKELLESQDERRLGVAAECVAQWPDAEFLPLLQPILLRGNKSPVVTSSALGLALRGFGINAPLTVKKVRAELDNVSHAHFLDGISRLPCQESWDLLVESLSHQAIEVRASAMRGLFHISKSRWTPNAGQNPNNFPQDAARRVHSYALETLSDFSPPVRLEAVRALDIKRTDRSVWNRLAFDPSPLVRLNLLEVLDQLDPEVAIDMYWGLLTDLSLAVRETAMMSRTANSDLTIRALRETKSPNPICREVAAKVLAPVAMAAYLEDVGPLLNDRVASVREAAAIALLSFGDKGFDLLLRGIGRLSQGSVKKLVDHLGDLGADAAEIHTLNQIASKVNPAMASYIAGVIKKIQKRNGDGDGRI